MPGCPRDDWQREVFDGDTNLGYWDWCIHRAEQVIRPFGVASIDVACGSPNNQEERVIDWIIRNVRPTYADSHSFKEHLYLTDIDADEWANIDDSEEKEAAIQFIKDHGLEEFTYMRFEHSG